MIRQKRGIIVLRHVHEVTPAISMFRIALLKANHGILAIAGTLVLVWMGICSSLGVAQEFRAAVQPLIESSCLDCHDGSDENGLDFKTLKFDLDDDAGFRKWERIFDRVTNGEMPPESETRPEKELVSRALNAVGHALKSTNDRFQKRKWTGDPSPFDANGI